MLHLRPGKSTICLFLFSPVGQPSIIPAMPLNISKKINRGLISTWQIEEPEAWFSERLRLENAEADELSKIKGKRRLEWLACRWLTHQLLCNLQLSHEMHRTPISKDEFGKPHLKELPFEISFSHSHNQVAVMLHPVPCGVDLQFFVPKIQRIAHKFLSVEEAESLDSSKLLEHLHFYWAVKEAAYKAYGRKQLEFREHILVEPFHYGQDLTQVEIRKEGKRHRYQVEMKKMEDYFLAWCWETTGEKPFEKLPV